MARTSPLCRKRPLFTRLQQPSLHKRRALSSRSRGGIPVVRLLGEHLGGDVAGRAAARRHQQILRHRLRRGEGCDKGWKLLARVAGWASEEV
eukprot:1168194-Prymnesium_polylepis.2